MKNKLEELKAAVWDARVNYFGACYAYGRDYDAKPARIALFDALDAYESALDVAEGE